MEQDSDFDIEAYCEKALAMEFVLQGICSALPKEQADKVLIHLARLQEHFADPASEKDGTRDAWKRVMVRINPFVEILSGLPPRSLH
jgi:hypothetical protein